MTLVASALAGSDCIDDADVLRTGGTAGAIGCVVKASSTLGTFLRSFSWGHARQLDRVSRELLGPGLGCWGQTLRRAPDHGSVPSSIRVRSQAFFGGLSGLVVTPPVAPMAFLCELPR